MVEFYIISICDAGEKHNDGKKVIPEKFVKNRY